MNIQDGIYGGVSYLLSQIQNGVCMEFDQLRNGPSAAWTTACVGSTLAEFFFPAMLADMRDTLLALQWKNGGWSYNQKVQPDADTTLRVMQFLQKIAFADQTILARAEQFVISHQQTNGGIATYLPETVLHMGYQSGGWTTSHPCVSALAFNILRDADARQQLLAYLQRLTDSEAYWWKTVWYVLYETGINSDAAIGTDPVEFSLSLLARSKHGIADPNRMQILADMQQPDGSFPVSHQFRIPRPHQLLSDLKGDEETVADQKGIFSTCAAVVALSRQHDLLNGSVQYSNC